MRYILANVQLAQSAGLKLAGHRKNGSFVIYNEKEIINAPSLKGSLEERVILIGGEIYTRSEILTVINKNKLKL